MHFGTIQLLSSSSSFPVPGEGEGGHCESMRRGPPWESIEHGTTIVHWRVAKRKDWIWSNGEFEFRYSLCPKKKFNLRRPDCPEKS